MFYPIRTMVPWLVRTCFARFFQLGAAIFWRSVRLTGVSTVTWHIVTVGMAGDTFDTLLRKPNTRPDWVSPGILMKPRNSKSVFQSPRPVRW